MVHIFPSARLIGLGFVSIYSSPALLRKYCLLKVFNNGYHKPVLARGRAARLSHNVVMLSGEES